MAIAPDKIRRGSVVLVRLAGDKARPAVVAHSDLLAELPGATRLPLTSDVREGVSLRIDAAPAAANGLRTASQLMTDWPQPVRLTEIGAVIGTLPPPLMRIVSRELAVELGIGMASSPVGP